MKRALYAQGMPTAARDDDDDWPLGLQAVLVDMVHASARSAWNEVCRSLQYRR